MNILLGLVLDIPVSAVLAMETAESIRQTWNTKFLRKHWLRLDHEGSSKKKSSILRIPKNPWLTFEQFKDTLVEYQLTLS